jgi:hypothetical protein
MKKAARLTDRPVTRKQNQPGYAASGVSASISVLTSVR